MQIKVRRNSFEITHVIVEDFTGKAGCSHDGVERSKKLLMQASESLNVSVHV